jgi:hypothetical protein
VVTVFSLSLSLSLSPPTLFKHSSIYIFTLQFDHSLYPRAVPVPSLPARIYSYRFGCHATGPNKIKHHNETLMDQSNMSEGTPQEIESSYLELEQTLRRQMAVGDQMPETEAEFNLVSLQLSNDTKPTAAEINRYAMLGTFYPTRLGNSPARVSSCREATKTPTRSNR